MYHLVHWYQEEDAHDDDSPVEGQDQSRDTATEHEGSLIAVDTMGQNWRWGKCV